ncbi:MAG: hypothetical protein WCO56_02105 [Verrucomicrobiota bacterium]
MSNYPIKLRPEFQSWMKSVRSSSILMPPSAGGGLPASLAAIMQILLGTAENKVVPMIKKVLYKQTILGTIFENLCDLV